MTEVRLSVRVITDERESPQNRSLRLISTFSEKDAIQFRANECAEGRDVKPNEGCDACTKGPVEHRVVGDPRNVPTKCKRGREPYHRGRDGPRHDMRPMLSPLGAKMIECTED